MKTVLFLVQKQLSSCTLLAGELEKSSSEGIQPVVRGTFTWSSTEMSEYSFEGIKGLHSEMGTLKTEQLQRSDLEQADVIVLISQAEESLTHLLKASEKKHVIIRASELSGRSMEDLEYMLHNDQTAEVIKDLQQKSVELAAKL
ncbi:hypothetical protein [Jeotgalibacillus haloalkalitolerans]|uniref:Phosphotyrosine protein phosphatase I domain-containing protein n=1 Tax=Jeotgalibacillus haloalkalitolerans TaxID=3104292 RepID=A0ABU5KQ66_9BACL|nr:hypothetical protein [Jeotgalibacillus sp. HH7-29]MDZ5713393.1 hypothetical protein [Jeotgalibacillus sp. HH7-29]